MLKTVVDTLDGLDEATKALYAESEGKFILQIEGVDNHPEVVRLKTAFQRVKEDKEELKTERDALKSKVSEMPEDFDPEKWEKFKDGKPDEAALIGLRRELEADRDDWKAKAETAAANALQSALDRDLTDALTGAGVTNPMFARAARGMLAPSVKIGDDGAAFVDTDMGPIGLADHVKRWVAGEGKDFVTPARGGGASAPSGGGAGKKWGEMTSGEKVALNRENPAEYERIKAAG